MKFVEERTAERKEERTERTVRGKRGDGEFRENWNKQFDMEMDSESTVNRSVAGSQWRRHTVRVRREEGAKEDYRERFKVEEDKL